MGKHLVLAGGGHAHMVTLANLHRIVEKGHKVTVIGPSAYHYYSGMGPGMLSGTYTPEEIRFSTKHVVEKYGGTFILDMIDSIDPKNKNLHLESGEVINYDVVSFNVGSHVPKSIVSEDSENVFSVKPIERLLEAKKRIIDLVSEKEAVFDIIGGGPAAAEIAGNIWQLIKIKGGKNNEIRIFAGKNFMSRFDERIKEKTVQSVTKRGIKIIEDGYVREITTGEIVLESGKAYKSNFIILAVGVKPSEIFEKSGMPVGPDGGLLVNRYLQSTEYPEIFGGGDCIYFKDSPLDKVGVYAVRENPILYNNLIASLDGTELLSFDPGGDYLLIFNLGGNTGILKKKWMVHSGKAAFFIKDYIDRKFMKKFQSIE
ncbi:MAG: FAD-dependent oxidoreductase [Desulfobacterales bacterium]|jgi:NADH dehydrogenase FAD-containing subunit|nr:FAD-dependent oxidoreductase [Desulfobacteraceae bacterium]MBT4365630.1 FAD-dependent oxidoreductase [Desulfobacteraceae bacterium]MBT7085140.1 FAD-dependent oxidoreductase [Desulfobacterales bacterium]